MKLNEYCDYSSSRLTEARARLIVVPPGEYLALLRRFHQDRGYDELRLSDIMVESAWLPMPDEILGRVRKKIATQAQGRNAFVLLGMHGYLSLLTCQNKRAAIIALREWLDSTSDQHVVCFLQRDGDICSAVKDVFANPRYRQGKQLIEIDTEETMLHLEKERMEVMLVGTGLASYIPESCDTFQSYLRHTEEHPDDRSIRRIVVASGGRELPGLSTEVRQVLSLRDFAYMFYDIFDAELSDDALRWVCQRGKECVGGNLFDISKTHFFPDGDIERKILGVFDSLNHVEREVVLWFVKKAALRETYLEYVVSKDGINAQNFRFEYVFCANECLEKFEKFSAERKAAICYVGSKLFDADIRQFICACTDKSTSKVSPWLNCGTDVEHAELLRRCVVDGVVSNSIKAVYPDLAAYLNSDFDFGNEDIDSYFREYRNLKVVGQVNPGFYDKAQQKIPPSSVQWRDEMIQHYVKDMGCSLLVVDAMGAEWMPMLIELARQRNIAVDSVMVCKAKIPTSTEFNNIDWSCGPRRLRDIKRFDNIAHNGVEAHEIRRPEENFASALDVISNEVLPRVAEGLVQFDRVLVTADHGSSRLAVLAWQYEPKLARTLICEEGAVISAWRYRERSGQGSCPPELEESLDGNYWVVRGYNRLPKKGGGQGLELHGGATLEERLVPVVVFSKSGKFVPKTKAVGKRIQLVEKDDFDL